MTIGIVDPNATGMPDRVVERRRGCWSCAHYISMLDEGGEIVRQQYKLARAAARFALSTRVEAFVGRSGNDAPQSFAFYTVLGELLQRGIPQEKAIPEALRLTGQKVLTGHLEAKIAEHFELWDRMFREGLMGMCLIGKVPTSRPLPPETSIVFIHCQDLCDSWNGRQGSSIATACAPPDKDGEELLDRANSGEKLK